MKRGYGQPAARGGRRGHAALTGSTAASALAAPALALLALVLLAQAGCGDGADSGPDAEDAPDAVDDGAAEHDTPSEADGPTDGTGEADPEDDDAQDGDGDPAQDDLLPETSDGGDSIDDGLTEEESGPEPTEGPGWRVRTTAETTLYQLESECLEAIGTVPAGTELDAWGMNDLWVRTTWTGQHIARSDIEIIVEPPSGEDPPASWEGAVGLEESGVYTLDGTGCAVQTGAAYEGDIYPAYGLSHDFNYHGYWQVSPRLDMIPVRVLNVTGWIFPWHRTVLLIKEIPDVGFLVGGGVLIAPGAILTAAHMAVDAEFCYVLSPNTADAYYAGEGVCGVLDQFVTHPGIDLGIMLLTTPETRVPPVDVLERYAAVGDEFYAVTMSTMHYNAMNDAIIDEVDGRHNTCNPAWPGGSSFSTQATIVGGGDSGGPAFIGDGLAGIVHGEACRWPWEPYRQVFVHVPFAVSWIESVLGP